MHEARIKTWKSLLIAGAILSTLLPARLSRADEIDDLIAKEAFTSAWKLPEELTLTRIQSLLNRFSAATFGSGFKVIGDQRDFFHGHVLFTADSLTREGRMKPFAILYHTQEDAHDAHWGDGIKVDRKFDYIDVRTRNWIQWLSESPETDGLRIENARAYVNEAVRDPSVFFGENVAVEGEHYTIHGKKLDAAKLGVKPIGEFQWEFYKMGCNDNIGSLTYFSRGPLRVALPEQGDECLEVRTTSVFVRHPN